jgi:hypothetical protein
MQKLKQHLDVDPAAEPEIDELPLCRACGGPTTGRRGALAMCPTCDRETDVLHGIWAWDEEEERETQRYGAPGTRPEKAAAFALIAASAAIVIGLLWAAARLLKFWR